MNVCSETAMDSEKLGEVEVYLPVASLDPPSPIAEQRLRPSASVVFKPAVLHGTVSGLSAANLAFSVVYKFPLKGEEVYGTDPSKHNDGRLEHCVVL